MSNRPKPTPRTLPCLTICQPWAWAIFNGKDVENRPWESRYRGPLLIHAGASHDWLCDSSYLRDLGLVVPPDDELVFGAILGLVDQVDCWHQSQREIIRESVWAEGPWCHVYANPRPFAKPVPYKGRQKFFGVPLSMLPEVEVLMQTSPGGPATGGSNR